MLKPYPLSAGRIDDASLAEDRKTCRKIGPCGIGRHALYLNSFFVDRRYYVPFSMVTRVYKRVAMSKGGFSGKGIFATLSYLVVEFDGGQKVCNFKYEQQVDEFLRVIRAEHPSIPCVSAAAEQRIAEEKARREEEERNRPPMSAQAEKTVQALDNAIDYLERRPELTERLSAAAKRRWDLRRWLTVSFPSCVTARSRFILRCSVLPRFSRLQASASCRQHATTVPPSCRMMRRHRRKCRLILQII